MAKGKNTKKTSNNTTINVLIIVCTIVIIALAVLIAVSFGSKNNKNSLTDNNTNETSMLNKINELDIKENPVATLEMENGGVMTIELYPKTAPNTVCNFIELANSGYYDGLIFHRCIQDFMIQGGDPQGTGMGGPDYSIAGEFSSNGFENNLSHKRGVISMARSNAPDSAGSQFFITVADSDFLDGEYAAFGRVLEGMDVADEIVANETDENDKPLTDQVIKSIRVDTKGVEYPEAEKIQ